MFAMTSGAFVGWRGDGTAGFEGYGISGEESYKAAVCSE